MGTVKDYVSVWVMGLAVAATPVVSNAAFIVQPVQKTPENYFYGPYLGISVGGARESSSYETNPGCSAPGTNGVFCTFDHPSIINGTEIAAIGTNSFTSTGPMYGAHGGFNWQNGGFVYGAEADFSGTDLENDVTISGLFPFVFLGDTYTLTESTSTDWLATIRARAGVTLDSSMLFYATAGAAFARFNASSTYSDNAVDITFPGGLGSGNNTAILNGLALGVGTEWFVTDALSLRVEYLHIDFNSIDVVIPVSNTPDYTQVMAVSFTPETNLLRVGLSFYIA